MERGIDSLNGLQIILILAYYKKKGHKSKTLVIKKLNINNPRKLEESEYEELIRLNYEYKEISSNPLIIEKKDNQSF